MGVCGGEVLGGGRSGLLYSTIISAYVLLGGASVIPEVIVKVVFRAAAA